MIVQQINFLQFWTMLESDDYSNYSYEAAIWIYDQLELWSESNNGVWELDLPAIRGTFTEIPEEEWEDFKKCNHIDWYGKLPNGYIVENQ